MKPPARQRRKPARGFRAEEEDAAAESSGQGERRWQPGELRRLLTTLKKLDRTQGADADIDYTALKNAVPTRSISEIRALVESLKTKLISAASLKLKKRQCKEKKAKKPIELWTEMASVVAGTLEEPITTAFSQMLIVSSTEPCTLTNCDPPRVLISQTGQGAPIGRTIPFRPMPRALPVQREHPGLDTPKTPGLRVVASKSEIPPPQQKLPAAAGAPPAAVSNQQDETVKSQLAQETPGQVVASMDSAAAAQTPAGSSLIQTTQEQEQQTKIISTTPKSTSSAPHTPLSPSTAGPTPPPGTAKSSVAPPGPQLPNTTCHDRFGRTSKFATKDSPRVLGLKCVVDFERIYRYLSAIVSPNEDCRLTPMESAIVLDLLMSLPEEIPHLDCNKLRKHLIKVYRCLSSPADTKTWRVTFKNLKDQMEASGSSGNTHNGEGEQQPDGAASKNTSKQSGDKDDVGPCPPLNPFMVPLSLLTRRSVRTQDE